MNKSVLLLFLLIQSMSCSSTPQSIPLGQWSYTILANGVEVGSAQTSCSLENDRYITVSDMKMQAGEITNTVRQVIIETTAFKPVRLETRNKIITGTNTENIDTIADFDGKKVALKTDNTTTTLTIEKPYVLNGNLYMAEMIKAGFKEGTEIALSVYEPSIELEEPITMKIKVMGREPVTINGAMKNLIHVIMYIENMKNIDVYIDDKGIAQKMVIIMLNNRLELVIK